MIIKDVLYADSDFNIRQGCLYIESGKVFINSRTEDNDELILDSNSLVLPGFIDIHTHGAMGADTCDANESSYMTLSKYYASHGVTSFCPTTMTESPSHLRAIFNEIANFMGREPAAYIQGINMEGPYISQEKKGAQNGKYIRSPDIKEFCELNKICHVCLVDVAPEVDGAIEFSRVVRDKCTVSLAHTAADSNTARLAFENGFSHVTHMFNAMNGIKAREPGIPVTVFENDATAELICDGFHIAPSVLRMAFSFLKDNRAVVISDSMRSAGCPDGEYELGGQPVFVKDGHARLEDGTIAASTTNLFDEFLFLLDIGIPFSTALRACTINPAHIIGVSDNTGSIEDGKNADLLILDKNMNISYVLVKGKVVYKNV